MVQETNLNHQPHKMIFSHNQLHNLRKMTVLLLTSVWHHLMSPQNKNLLRLKLIMILQTYLEPIILQLKKAQMNLI